jgi:hypothetical protein
MDFIQSRSVKLFQINYKTVPVIMGQLALKSQCCLIMHADAIQKSKA